MALDTTSTTVEVAGTAGGSVAVEGRRLRALVGRGGGRFLVPGESGWNEAVLVWNGMAATTPALVYQPDSAAGVAAVVDLAREEGLLLTVKGGGHNLAGTALAEGALTVDLSRLRDIAVEPAARRAHVGGGCRLHDVDRATQAHGLATVLGFVSEVGVAGLTLGGGLGYLTRRFGWTVDNLEEVEIVTADGEVRTASPDENQDLFWALRGGGGNFGIVTRFTFRLHEVGPTVYGGLIAWPFERAAEVMDTYRWLTATAPRQLAVWLPMIAAPPAPFVPTDWHGRRVCAMAVCFTGDLADAPDLLAPVRALGEPVFDLLGERPYTEVQSYLDDAEPKGLHYYWKSEFVAGLSDDLLATARELYADCPVDEGQIGFLHLEGALSERPPDDGAVGNRDAAFAVGVLGAWEPDDPRGPSFRQWVRDAGEALRPASTGNYVNFQTADEGDDRIRATYGGNYARLIEAKRRWDPDNLFRVNRNLAPGAGA